MTQATDPITLALTGALPFAVLAAALIAFPAAPVFEVSGPTAAEMCALVAHLAAV
jgi:hypothetical protein